MARWTIPKLVVAGLIFLIGLVNMVITDVWVRPLQEQALEGWIRANKPSGSEPHYARIYQDAKDSQEELARLRVSYGRFVGASGMVIGLLIAGWALDRNRLIKRTKAAKGEASAGAG